MSQLARYLIAREPDLTLSVGAGERGWSLLTSAQSAAGTTSSPAGLLLTPKQVLAIAPLAALKGSNAKSHDGLFDPLYTSLETAFAAKDFEGIAEAASSFLQRHPIASLHTLSPHEQQIRRFFIFKGKSSTSDERLALHDSIAEKDRRAWLSDAPARIDREKAQTLAIAVSGLAPPPDSHLLGGLQADLAFAVLDACLAAGDRKKDRRNFPDKYVDYVLSLSAFLPYFVFELDVCRARDSDTTPPPDSTTMRLARLSAYEAKLQSGAEKTVKASAKSAVAGRTKASAAGKPSDTTDCDCDCDAPRCAPIDPCCPKVRWYVAELLTLKDQTWCYKPSDIAYIENVAPFEFRTRSHGLTRTVAETSEDETNTSRAEERDHQVTDRFNLQKEIQNNQKASLDVDAKLSNKASGYSISTDASLSKESSYREAREQAREDVSKATLKIQVQTRKLRRRTVTTETTERNRHAFKNSTALPAVAKYFWVTQEKRAQLFGHGPRIMVDLLVPSPAMLFQHMEAMKRADGFTMKAPVAPEAPQANGQPLKPTDITRDNYELLAAKFGVIEYDDPPATPQSVTVSFQSTYKTGASEITIPAGFTATMMKFGSADLIPKNPAGAWISIIFGGQKIKAISTGDGPPIVTGSPATISERASATPVLNKGRLTGQNSSIGVTITLDPDPVDLRPWQKSIFALILTAHRDAVAKYEAALADYNDALTAYNEKFDESRKDRHPFACEEIMRTELKRLAIFSMCGEFDWPDVMNMDSELCHFPWPNRRKADKATNDWYFFDRGFDWNLASFIFYDYFRNPLCKWVDSYEPDEPNFLFKAFLRAGYARIQVPVSPGMEKDVLVYLQTGRPWPDGIRPTNPGDARWISVIDEIKQSRDCYQQDREGHAEAYDELGNGQFDSRVRIYTDRYWDILSGDSDQDAINLDLDRQIFIDGVEYRIVSLIEDPASPNYSAVPADPPMQWIVGLDRALEFQPYIEPAAAKPVLKPYNYAVGAQYVGAPFHFDLPTDLIWIGDTGNPCLPCYPIECARDEVARAAVDDDDRAVLEKAH